MPLPNVNIKIGNGNLGRVAQSNDGVAGLVITGKAVAGKLDLDNPYQLSSARDLTTLGVTSENNILLFREVTDFYQQAGDGSELHILVTSEPSLLVDMADMAFENLVMPLAGRIKLLAFNNGLNIDYNPVLSQGIDKDVIDASLKLQQLAENYARNHVMPLRVLLPCYYFENKDTPGSLLPPDLYEPRKSSCNRVAFVAASTILNTYPVAYAAMGLVLGRAAKVEPHQSLGRVKDGAIATDLYVANCLYHQYQPYLAKLHDAGYIVPIKYPTKNGMYLNGNPMAAPVTDDYSELNLGRVIDKAHVICYDTYISEILDNIIVDEKGQIPSGTCKYFEGMIENAIGIAMSGQISGFTAYVNPDQNVLSSGTLEIACSITPLGTLQNINVNLAFTNPALNK